MDKSQYIFGIRSVIEAIRAGRDIDKVLIRKDFGHGPDAELARELLALLKETDTFVRRVPVEKLNRVTMKNHQGVIAMLSPVTYYNIEEIVPSLYDEGAVPLLLILDGVTDTRNFGAIARTAECAGVDAIIIPLVGSASVTPDAVKTSAGALLSMPVCRVSSIPETLKYLHDSGIRIIGTADSAKEDYWKADYTLPTAIIMGAEDVGMQSSTREGCDALVSIPMIGEISSLNVSVATGVVVYEAVRQRLNSGFRPE